MIVDFHSHDFADSIASRAIAGMCKMTAGVLYPVGDGTLVNHLDHMVRAGVDLAVSAPICTKPSQFEIVLKRARAIRDGAMGERARRMIAPFASVHPSDEHVAEHLEQIAAAGIRGVKFHCYYQNFSLADPAVTPMFERIADLGLVALCHCGADVGWRDVRGMCGPDEIATLLKRVNRPLKFVAAHLGGCDGYPAHATDVLLDTGCYIDTSVLHRRWHYDEAMRLVNSWPTDRILFGTDFPWTDLSEAIAWVKSIRDPRDWNSLFATNALKLLA